MTHPSLPIRLTLQSEGAVLAALCISLFAQTQTSWWVFAALILLPDVAMLGYLAGNRVGALCYNLAHSTLAPAALAGIGYMSGSQLTVAIALIWGAHIGLDRAIGYGLKYARSFNATHLQQV